MVGDQRVVAGGVDDELELESFRIVDQRRAVEPLAACALGPEVERLLGGDAEDDAMHHPVAGAPVGRARVLEEGDVGARVARLVCVEQVVDGGVVLVHRLLHETQPERAGVELDVGRGVARDARHMVDAFELHDWRLLCPRYDRRDEVRCRSPRSGPRRVHGRDPRRAARRQGRLHRGGARARGHVPAGRLHSHQGVGTDCALPQHGARLLREARRGGRRSRARLHRGRQVEGRRRRADDRGDRLPLQGERRRMGARRARSPGRTRSRSRAERTSTSTRRSSRPARSRSARRSPASTRSSASTRPACSRRRRCRNAS